MVNSLCREEKIRKRADYVLASSSGKRNHTPHFIVVWYASGKGRPRIGITASRKVGSAVVRNRVKRLVREYFRLHKAHFIDADFNVIAKRGADKISFHEVCRELEKAVLCIRNTYDNAVTD